MRKEIEMVKWRLVYTKAAEKDAREIARGGLQSKAEKLLAIVESNPYQNPPPYERLLGDLEGAYSRRINIQQRLVYQVLDKERAVKILRLWTHYEQGPSCRRDGRTYEIQQ